MLYEVITKRISHPRSYTAQKTAAKTHISGKEIAKTVIIKIDGCMHMAVLPASHQLDVKALLKATGAKDVRLAEEAEFLNFFGDCEAGAMPPFGNLYNIKVYVAEVLTKDITIAFNACSHTELIQMSYSDFQRLVQPIIVKMAMVQN